MKENKNVKFSAPLASTEDTMKEAAGENVASVGTAPAVSSETSCKMNAIDFLKQAEIISTMKSEKKAPNYRQTVSKSQLKSVVESIPADLPYCEWILVAAAIKNEGGDWEMFNTWSQSAPERYDEDAAKKAWESMGGVDHPEVTMGTLRFLQKRNNIKTTPPPAEFLPCPQTEEEMHKQREDFLNRLFAPDEFVELISPTAADSKVPDRPGVIGRIESALSTFEQKPLASGAWFCLNPIRQNLSGKAPKDDDITAYRHVLIEADSQTKEEQWQAITSLPVIPPVVSVVWSGKKSLHFVIRVDAADRNEYKERVKLLYEYLEKQNIAVDKANKNPSRLSRLPGVKRGEEIQYLVSGAFGTQDWRSFALRISEKKEDRRSTTSAINGALGGRPPIDIDSLGESILAELEENGERLLHWKGNFWFYQENWEAMPQKEWTPKLTNMLLPKLQQNQLRFSNNVVKDVSRWLEGKVYLGQKECPKQPYLLEQGKGGEEYMIFTNGAVSLKELKEKTPAECTFIPMGSNIFGECDVDYAFDPEADCPRWKEAVNTMFPEESEQRMFQQCFGYILSRSVSMNTGFIWHGAPGTAKSQAANIIRWLLGEKNCSALAFEELKDKFSTAMLTESYLNITEEFPTGGTCRGQNNAEGMFKTATCGGVLKTEKKGQDPGKGRATARFIFCGNDLPIFHDKEAIWDRLVIIQFEHVFRGMEGEIGGFAESLRPELPGILNWAAEGMRSLGDAPRFPMTAKAKHLLEEHRRRCDVEGSFIREYLQASPDSITDLRTVWQLYQQYCDVRNYVQENQANLRARIRKEIPCAKEGHTLSEWGGDVRILRNVKLIREVVSPDEFKAKQKENEAPVPLTAAEQTPELFQWGSASQEESTESVKAS